MPPERARRYRGASTYGYTVSPGTGFLHPGNRWYSPPVEPFAGVGNQVGPGHVTQPDSYTQLDNPANGNLYAYAANSPTNSPTPTGACSFLASQSHRRDPCHLQAQP